MNIVMISGKIIGNLQLETTSKNLSFVKFKLSNKRENKYNKIIKENINCVAWNEMARYFYKNLKAGDYIIINGYISSKDYTTIDGRVYNTTEIVVNKIELPDHETQEATGAI